MQVRVCLRHVGPDGDRLRFDLSLGVDLKPLADKVHFGFWGAVGGVGDATGVLLSPDGVIDLGSGYELHDRFHKTNLMRCQTAAGTKTGTRATCCLWLALAKLVRVIANRSVSRPENAVRW